MLKLKLSEEQAKAIAEATEPVELCDPQGRLLGQVAAAGLTPEQFFEIKRRASADGPRYTSDEVQDFLVFLKAEWQRRGGFDRKHLDQLLTARREQKALQRKAS